MKPTTLSLILALSILCAATATAQFPIHAVKSGNQTAQVYGSAVAGVGDIDGDGAGDLIVGAPGTNRPGFSVPTGAVELVSGADGSRIWARYGDNNFDGFGTSVTGGFDVNGDGISEIAVGVPRFDNVNVDSGAVYILEGKTKKVLRIIFGRPTAGALFGNKLATIGDVNDDGMADFLIAGPSTSYLFGAEGMVQVMSGRDLRIIRRHRGSNLFDQLGTGLSALPDIDGDGVADYAIGITGFDGGGVNRGAVDLISGFDGSRIKRFKGKFDQSQFGASICSTMTPGVPDSARLYIGSPADNRVGNFGGRVEIMSLREFATVKVLTPDSGFDRLGTTVVNAGDVNGDGEDDVLVAATGDDLAGPNSGTVTVLSGKDLTPLTTYTGVVGAAFGISATGLGDVNADGIDDFAIGAWDPGLSILEGNVTIRSYMGVEKIPVATGALDLVWLSGTDLGNDRPADGGLLATDIPGRRCAIRTSFAVAGLPGPIYNDPMTTFFREVFLMPPSGSRLFPVDLQDPSMAGVTVTTQVVRWPLLNQVSTAYNILFGG